MLSSVLRLTRFLVLRRRVHSLMYTFTAVLGGVVSGGTVFVFCNMYFPQAMTDQVKDNFPAPDPSN